jgi:hypothetical protein
LSSANAPGAADETIVNASAVAARLLDRDIRTPS